MRLGEDNSISAFGKGCEMLRKAIIIKERCPQDHPCPALPKCPTDAILQKGYNAPEVIEEKCIGCGKCVKICPTGAFQFER